MGNGKQCQIAKNKIHNNLSLSDSQALIQLLHKKNAIQNKLYKNHISIQPHNHSFFKQSQFHMIFIPTTFFLLNLQKSKKKYQLSNSSKTKVPYIPHSSFPCKPHTNIVYIPNGTLFPM